MSCNLQTPLPLGEGRGKRMWLGSRDSAPSNREELARRGHALQPIGERSVEVGGHAIARHPMTGVLMGGADPRRDGYALGL
jgi:hypothetical protein